MVNINLMHGDCLELMKTIPDGSVDLVLTDPPYGTMKGAERSNIYGKKDNPKHEWDEVLDNDKMWHEINRVLRVNGCCILFSQDPYTYQLATQHHNNVPFSYRMAWHKDTFAFALGAKKFPVNYFEDVCVFFKKHTKHDFEGTHPLRDYADKIFDFIGKTRKEIFSEMGHQGAFHWFLGRGSVQFGLCTRKTYDELIERYSINKMQGFREYKDIEEVNAVYRADLIERMTNQAPRVFNLHDGKKYKSNILEYKKDYNGYHPTQKPVALLEDLIKTYTNEGKTVLDFTMGSGSAGVACVNTNRNFIGIELDETYFKIAQERINDAQHNGLLL